MSNPLSLGYPLPSDSCFHISNWDFSIDGEHLEKRNTDEPFSYYSTVACTLGLEVELEEIRKQCGFSDVEHTGVELGVALVWFSSGTKQRGSQMIKSLKDGFNELHLELPGTILGGELEVHVVVFLKSGARDTKDAITATLPGSILWQSNRQSIALEGEGARFAIAPLDFKKAGIHSPDAMWRVEFTGSLFAPAQAAILVYINSGNSISKLMLTKPDSRESIMWHQFLEADVISQLLLHGSKHASDLKDLTAEDEGSLGESIKSLFDSLFPGQDPESFNERPNALTAAAQALVFRNAQ
ncbi:hypothetical protein [Corynebacterium suicordis]|uniref:Uncharacterized protein n=1 Tax=Corynebacterium suicordis DSM 45110 TaxID=1121369 RepID=A0ABR9ZGG8_9CORY|nr:hypothetical protein [Corynebacterium suicordis]MBF4552499.1 hypothetical protein [Corynebacterium suicordis DSM 45110]MDR6278542.1 hypothetical protein [Corynebacterium suicordis]